MRAVAWIGALLFAGSLGYFAYFYAVVLGRVVEPAADPAVAAAWNVALFSLFALHHSVLARSGAKQWVARLLPAELERSVYVSIASLLFLAVCTWWQPLPGVVWEIRGPVRFAFSAAQLAGVVLTLRAAAIIDIRDLAGLTDVTRTTTRAGHGGPVVFTTTGPYGWLRHPIYLGWVLVVCVAPTMTAGRALFAGISSLYLVMAIPLEERSLVQVHGDGYRRYQRLVKWKLIPGIW